MIWSLHVDSRGTVAATTEAPERSATRATPSGTAIVAPKNSTSTPEAPCGTSISAATIWFLRSARSSCGPSRSAGRISIPR